MSSNHMNNPQDYAEISIRIPKSWQLKLASCVEAADYPSLNAMILELLDEAYDLPREEWMVGNIDEWWEKL